MDHFSGLLTAWDRLRRNRDELEKQRERCTTDFVQVLGSFLESLDPNLPPFHTGGNHPRYNSVAGYVNLRTRPFVILHDYIRAPEPKPELLYCPLHTINGVSTTKQFVVFHPPGTDSEIPGVGFTEWATDSQLQVLEYFDLRDFVNEKLRALIAP